MGGRTVVLLALSLSAAAVVRGEPVFSSQEKEEEEEEEVEERRWRKAAFVDAEPGYGYRESLGSWEAFERYVAAELGGRMGPGEAYLDWAASALYTTTQVDAVAVDLKTHLYGNPHSLSSSATRSSEAVEAARRRVLAYVGAREEDYEVIFTRSCTDSLRLVAETFPWATGRSRFKYLLQNHNSVLGIRDVARSNGAKAGAVAAADVEAWLSIETPLDDDDDDGDGGDGDVRPWSSSSPAALHLFAYPGEENFAGAMYPMEWAAAIVGRRERETESPLSSWRVLVDGAKVAATHPVNLTRTPVDFFTLSFYKLFGLPTGVGGLVVRRSTAEELTKCYWGGGSVSLAGAGRSAADDLRVLKARVCERFEDGTVAFLSIAELKYGFEALDRVGGPAAIERHTGALAGYLDACLRALEHPSNHEPVVRVYGEPMVSSSSSSSSSSSTTARGPIVNFNVVTAAGAAVSHIEVMAAAARAGIHVRAGVECNPGAAYDALGVSPAALDRLSRDENAQGCGEGPAFVTCPADEFLAATAAAMMIPTEVDFASDAGQSASCAASFTADVAAASAPTVQVPLGSIRASVGYLSTFADVEALVAFIRATYSS